MKTFLYLLAILLPAFTFAQPAIDWQRCYGGSGHEEENTQMLNTADGGYLMVSTSESQDGMVNDNNGSSDVWVVKMDAYGLIDWKRCYGGSGAERINEVIQTSDGGYVISSSANASNGNGNDGDMSGCYSNEWGQISDAWVFKIDSYGNLVWQRCLGGSGYDGFDSIKEQTDGGVILFGSTSSQDGDVVGLHGSSDIWIVKLDSQGNLVWQRCLGGSQYEYIISVSTSEDGGYMESLEISSIDLEAMGKEVIEKAGKYASKKAKPKLYCGTRAT
jgi:hypothetical protein